MTFKSVTLLDPLVYKYASLKDSTFYSGKFQFNHLIYPTKMTNESVESFGEKYLLSDFHNKQQYDTVIMLNALPYSKNAFEFLSTLYLVLKPGGLLIFHDRWFDDPVHSSKCNFFGFNLNIVQVARPLLDHFISKFEKFPYLTTNQTISQKMRSKKHCKGFENFDEKGE